MDRELFRIQLLLLVCAGRRRLFWIVFLGGRLCVELVLCELVYVCEWQWFLREPGLHVGSDELFLKGAEMVPVEVVGALGLRTAAVEVGEQLGLGRGGSGKELGGRVCMVVGAERRFWRFFGFVFFASSVVIIIGANSLVERHGAIPLEQLPHALGCGACSTRLAMGRRLCHGRGPGRCTDRRSPLDCRDLAPQDHSPLVGIFPPTCSLATVM